MSPPGPEEKKMGIKGSSTRTLILDEAKVPVENVLGEVGKGHLIAFNILNIGRYKLGVGCVGSSKRAIEISAKYANERKQFETPIAQFPLIQEKLATMSAKTYALESVIYRLAGFFEKGLAHLEQAEGAEAAKAIAEYALECSIAKVFGSEVLDYVVDEGSRSMVVTGLCRSMKLRTCTVTPGSTGFLKVPTRSTAS